MKEFKTIQFIHQDFEYEADLEVIYHEDFNYGADADGNRGVYRAIIDDIKVLELRDEDGNVIKGNEKLEEIATDYFGF